MKVFLQKLERFPTVFALVFLCVGIYLARGVDGADIASWSKPALIPVSRPLAPGFEAGQKAVSLALHGVPILLVGISHCDE